MDQNISLGQAFKYCATLPAYWIWIGVVLVLLAGGLIVSEIFGRKKNIDVSNFKMIWCIVFILLLALTIGGWPFNVMWNTTVEMASKNHYLGF